MIAFALLAAIVAIGCVAASARRVLFAVAPTTLDASSLRQAIEAGEREKIHELIA